MLKLHNVILVEKKFIFFLLKSVNILTWYRKFKFIYFFKIYKLLRKSNRVRDQVLNC